TYEDSRLLGESPAAAIGGPPLKGEGGVGMGSPPAATKQKPGGAGSRPTRIQDPSGCRRRCDLKPSPSRGGLGGDGFPHHRDKATAVGGVTPTYEDSRTVGDVVATAI